jgi:hypothetical protein
MAARLPYETQSGTFSRSATILQLIEHLRYAQEAAAIIGHDMKEDGDNVDGQWFLAISEMVGNVCTAVTKVTSSRGVRQ